MTKENYFCSNESLTNIRKYCSSISQTDVFSIIINQETVSVPIEVAIAISSTITNSLVNDPTLREMLFQIKFRDKESINIIKSILKGDILSKDIFENKTTFYDICDFCVKIGNTFIIQSYIDNTEISDDINSLSYTEILQQLDIKQKISNTLFSQNNKLSFCSFTNEVNFIAKNFMDFIVNKDFIEWSKRTENIPLLEQILNSDDLLLDKEDSLLSFLIDLFEINCIFSVLFQYLFIEYCSESCINKLIESIQKSMLFASQSQLSILNCFTKGYLKLHNSYQSSQTNFLPLDSKRYKFKLISLPYIEGKPLNGIFNYSFDKNNLSLSASSNNNPGSSTYGDVYFLIHMKDGTSYATKNVANSYIEASLKDNSLFIIKRYLIRGSSSSGHQLQSWVLEGKTQDSEKWEILDSVNNSPIEKYESKVFSVKKELPIQIVRLKQTGANKSNYNYLYINGFEIYGEIFANS